MQVKYITFVLQDKNNIVFEFRSSCPIGSVLDLLGDKWSLLIIRDMMFFGKTTYSEFAESVERIASNILSDRLKKLEEFGFIQKLNHPTNLKTKVYTLTEQGVDLIPTMLELLKWSDQYLHEHIAPEARYFAQMLRKDRAGTINNIRNNIKKADELR